MAVCEARDCTNTIRDTGPGRHPRFCSDVCRVRNWRHHIGNPSAITVQIHPAEPGLSGRKRAGWLVQIKKRDRSVNVATGLTEGEAQLLAEDLERVLVDQ
jgi:hypothetical protein